MTVTLTSDKSARRDGTYTDGVGQIEFRSMIYRGAKPGLSIPPSGCHGWTGSRIGAPPDYLSFRVWGMYVPGPMAPNGEGKSWGKQGLAPSPEKVLSCCFAPKFG